MYKCINCGREFEDDLRRVRCQFCGYRILRKVRPKGWVKRVPAE